MVPESTAVHPERGPVEVVLEVVDREAVARREHRDVALADEFGERLACARVDERGPTDREHLAAGLASLDDGLGYLRDGRLGWSLRGNAALHEAESPALVPGAFGGSDPDAGLAGDDEVTRLDAVEDLRVGTGRVAVAVAARGFTARSIRGLASLVPALHDDGTVHLDVLHLDPLAVDTHVRRVVRRGVEPLRDDLVAGCGVQFDVLRVDRVRAVLVEFVDDALELFGGGGVDPHPGVGGGGLGPSDLELLDVERPAHVHDDAERGLHHPGVDDVALEFDHARDGHTGGDAGGALVGCGWPRPSATPRLSLPWPLCGNNYISFGK